MGKYQRILLLDNHYDFGGHAKRNEYSTPEGTIIGYGASESFQSPTHIYSPVVLSLLKSLNVDIQKMAKDFDVNFYPDLNLSRRVYFDKADFGEDKLVNADPDGVVADDIPPNRHNSRPITDYINGFPLSSEDRQALILLHTLPKDYLAGMDTQQKVDCIADGAKTPQTLGQLSWSMPGYHHTLDDQQLAELTNYVRGRFAGKHDKVTASQVSTILSSH